MYDPTVVLQSLDQHAVGVISLCGAAMVFNYLWFFLAARQGFRDKVYPVPMFSTLFWLCGDGTGVLRYDMYFNTYGHWYLELFWAALVFTVSFEILFIAMTLKFGHQEVAPLFKRSQFTAMLLAAAVIFVMSWMHLLDAMPDDLNVVYFNLANMAGPIGAAAMMLRRRSTAGTTTGVWASYTLMLMCWYTAQYLFFGPEFQTPAMIAFFVVNIASAAGLAVVVHRVQRQSTTQPWAGLATT